MFTIQHWRGSFFFIFNSHFFFVVLEFFIFFIFIFYLLQTRYLWTYSFKNQRWITSLIGILLLKKGPGEGFYLPDPCELTFANTLLLSNAAISLGNAFISLEISSQFFIFFSLFSFILAWTFISLQIKEFRIMGLSINDSVYSCLFFILTGLHFFHLLVGLLLSCLFFWSCSFSFVNSWIFCIRNLIFREASENTKYEVLLIIFFLVFLLFLVSEGLLFVSFFWTSFHSLSSPTLEEIGLQNAGFIILLTSIFTFFFFGEIRNLTTLCLLNNNGFSLSSFFLSSLSFLWIGAQFPQEKFLSYGRILTLHYYFLLMCILFSVEFRFYTAIF